MNVSLGSIGIAHLMLREIAKASVVILERLCGDGGSLELPDVLKIAMPSRKSVYCTPSRTEVFVKMQH